MSDRVKFKVKKNGGFYYTDYLSIEHGDSKFKIEIDEGKLKITKVDSGSVTIQ